LTQAARFAPLYEVPIADATCDVRATFFNTEKYDVDDEAPYFEQISIHLTVESPAPAEAVRALVRHAERACHAAQSFRHPIPVTLLTTLNGESLTLE
jgi:organic hydroperoxide reductase OsmC/OhrA